MATPPRAAGHRRYKALATWRFQPSYVRKQPKPPAAAAAAAAVDAAAAPSACSGGGVAGTPGAKCRGGLGASGKGGESRGDGGDFQSRRCTRSSSARDSDARSVEKEKGGRRAAGSDGDLGKSGRNASGLEGLTNGRGGGLGTGAEGEDCGLGNSSPNSIVRDSDAQHLASGSGARGGECISEGLSKHCVNSNSGSSAADCMLKETKGNDSSCAPDGAADGNNAAVRGSNSAGVGSNGDETIRKGRKAVVPWRFQVGYKRSFSKAFCSDTESSEAFDAQFHGIQDTSTHCSPATRSSVRCYASVHSGVRVSAMRDFSVKGEKETSSVYKKSKPDKDGPSQGMLINGVALARENIMSSLQDFRSIYKDLLLEEDDKSLGRIRPDLQAYRIFREQFIKECDEKKYIGNVPGIQVGDIFHLRVELCVVGLHRPHRLGVDHIKQEDGTSLAVSVVSYTEPSDVKNNLDVLVYSGSMTAIANQKIEGTNLALKKSMDTNTPVRVIHGFITTLNGKKLRTYIYGGLYTVVKYWREKESEDNYVYKFRLRRMEGQKHIDIQEILKSGQTESYGAVIIKDLSRGLERIPVSVVNSISDEYPMPYRYISRLQYPRYYKPAPPAGCGCVGGCSDSIRCACAVKNGGELPFNDKGCILEAKPLVYECGPSCKCPPTCHNRVGQHGLKFRLQVFKTKSMGWGVRTLDFIPSGSFVCEYIGEVLEDEEAQNRTTDEYLFAIGHNYYDEALWEGLSRSIPSLQKGPDKDEEAGFAVDASKMGNFAKFINHSCTPNVYAQNVLYDHDDKSVPHIMFFATEDIPPHQELAYHYNYSIDQVHDANGNIKKKKCLCGSIECDGWLY
uniref:SET domain-containing protein n=1 Tax=Leersia perrieri TaxID=77586 RepID=A0A0D9W7S2_9ORYZ